jgi:hypothetical protein
VAGEVGQLRQVRHAVGAAEQVDAHLDQPVSPDEPVELADALGDRTVPRSGRR